MRETAVDIFNISLFYYVHCASNEPSQTHLPW